MPQSKKNEDVNTDAIRTLSKLLEENDLTEIEYKTDKLHIRVAKQLCVSASAVMESPPAEISAPASAAPSEDAYADHPGLVSSPMVGIIYSASDPDASPFVTIGDQVSAGSTLLMIEAMKVFTPIKAHIAGTISRILVNNGTPVEYGEPLIIIE